jgi:thioredoxin 1
MAIQFTDKTVKEMIETGKPVVIDFWAEWCGPCQRLSPIIDEMSDKYKEQVYIGKYNIENDGDLCQEHRIMSVPTVLFFKDGKKTNIKINGLVSKDDLESKILDLLKL